MHRLEIRRFPGSTEKRYTHLGKYGAKGEKRAKRSKPTPEQMEYQNRKNRARNIRYLIKANFTENDLFVTLTYKKGTRKDVKEAAEDVRDLFKKLRPKYKKLEVPLKYIYACEIGERGGIHTHLIINECGNTMQLISGLWGRGHPNFKNLYKEGNYEQLADYMAKVPKDKEGSTKVQQCKKKPEYIYNHSRNLEKVEPEVHVYSRRTVKAIRDAIEQGAVTHEQSKYITDGYYIDRDSIRSGVNPYTGISYLEFTEVPIRQRE